MKVTLQKHGGQAAAIYLHLPPTVVDSDRLQPHQAAELSALVDNARRLRAVLENPDDGGADRMSYTISIEDKGDRTDLHQSHGNMDPAFKALRDWLDAYR